MGALGRGCAAVGEGGPEQVGGPCLSCVGLACSVVGVGPHYSGSLNSWGCRRCPKGWTAVVVSKARPDRRDSDPCLLLSIICTLPRASFSVASEMTGQTWGVPCPLSTGCRECLGWTAAPFPTLGSLGGSEPWVGGLALPSPNPRVCRACGEMGRPFSPGMNDKHLPHSFPVPPRSPAPPRGRQLPLIVTPAPPLPGPLGRSPHTPGSEVS